MPVSKDELRLIACEIQQLRRDVEIALRWRSRWTPEIEAMLPALEDLMQSSGLLE